jgi:hypothetical protein
LAPKWYEYAKSKLNADEVIEKTYEGRLDSNFGYLFLTNKRILFVKQEGLFRKNYEITMDLTKENIQTLETSNGNRINIVHQDGSKYLFESEIKASIIQESLQEVLMAN